MDVDVPDVDVRLRVGGSACANPVPCFMGEEPFHRCRPIYRSTRQNPTGLTATDSASSGM